jgi:hypothetical protein
MIDTEAESRALLERSQDLAAQLEAALPVVDGTMIREALAESRRLGDAAEAARAEVDRRLAAGKSPGCPLGPLGAIRKVRTLPNGRDAEPGLRGRTPITLEIVGYHDHRRDVVAAAYRAAYTEAAERLERRPTLVAAARGHITELRRRETYLTEGGQELETALRRFLDAPVALDAGCQEADKIAVAAEQALGWLRTAPAEAQIEAQHGPVAQFTTAQWVAAQTSLALGSEPVDAKTGAPIEAKPASSRR